MRQEPKSGGLKIEYVGMIAVICFVAGVLVGSMFFGEGSKATGPASIEQGGMMSGSPGNMTAQDFIHMGDKAYDQGNAEGAVHAYEKALQMEPHNPNVLTDLGTMLLQAGKTDLAISRFEQAAAVDPKHAKSRFNLGVARMHKKDYDKAAAAFQECLRIEPTGEMAKQSNTHLVAIQKLAKKAPR